MKKTLGCLMALCAALALFFTGCPNEGDPFSASGDDGGGALGEKGAFWLATDETGEKWYPDNKKILKSDDKSTTYAHVFFDPPTLEDTKDPTSPIRGRYLEISIEFEVEFDGPVNMMWQCAYDGLATWARGEKYDFIDTVTPGSEPLAVCRPGMVFAGKGTWGWTKEGEKLNPKPEYLNMKRIKGICIQMPAPGFENGDEVGSFTLKNVTWAISNDD